MGLLDSVKGVMTNAVIDKAADALGLENGMMKSAMKMFLPAMIGGVIGKGDTESKAGGLIDMFKNGGFGDGNLGDLVSILGDEDKRGGLLETGGDLLQTIFGNSQSGLIDTLVNATGLGKSSGSSLLKFIAPIVINKLAGMVFGKNMSAANLSSYLNEQKSEISGLVPGLSTMIGVGTTAKDTGDNYVSKSSSQKEEALSYPKWVLPLLLTLGLVALLAYKGCDFQNITEAEAQTEAKETVVEPKTNQSKQPTASVGQSQTSEQVTTDKPTIDPNAITVSDNGDILNESGSVLVTSGSYDIDGAGNIVDATGRIMLPAASLTPSLKSRFASLLDMIKLSRMRAMFSDMISKKSGAEATYALSNIEFNKEDHRIKNFSKAEVQGLAAALKANEGGNIEVHVHTKDGKDEKENVKLSEIRAKVITDMLTTLGVGADQLTNVGKGSENDAKATMDKVDIVIK